MKHTTNTLILTFILFFSASKGFAESTLTFDQAWIAEAPPVSRVLAAYMEIINRSDQTVIIDSIESDDFSKIEFHRTVEKNDMASMQHQENLPVPANGTLKLEPGSYHLMLFNPTRKLVAGDDSTFIVKTTDNHEYRIDVPVKKSDAISQHHHHHN